jgi:hypothetical protein
MLMMITNAERAIFDALSRSAKAWIASVPKFPKIKVMRVVLKPSSVL